MRFRLFSFYEELDEDVKVLIIRTAGFAAGALALFTLISNLSFLFTWKEDMSLLTTPGAMDSSVEVSNLAGKLGFKWAHTLVTNYFGLGSFAFVLTFGVLALRLIFGTRRFPVFKLTVLSVAAAIISSFILAFISRIIGFENAFGGGLGGECGYGVVDWAVNRIGAILTIFILAVFSVLWMFIASRRFSDWFESLGKSTPSEDRKPKAEIEQKGQAQTEDKKKKSFHWYEKKEKAAVAEIVEQENPVVDETPDDPQSLEESEPVPSVEVEEVKPTEPVSEAETEDGTFVVEEGVELSTEGGELPRIDVRDTLSDYMFPPLHLLEDYENSRQVVSQEELQRNNLKIRSTLKTFKIDITNIKAAVGPTVTLYRVYPAPGVRISQIKRLQDDIALSLGQKVRVTVLDDCVGIEVANEKSSIVPLKAMLNDESFRNTKAELPIAMGMTITQKVKVFDLTDAPHLLVAGATKQGKSVGLNVMIASLLYSKHPSELKFVFIDPKMVEFTAYTRLLKHYLAVLPDSASAEDERNNAIIKDPKTAEKVLRSLCIEMDRRYTLMSKAMQNNVKGYNEKYKDRHLLPTEGHEYLPYIVAVVDEYADLTMSAGAGDAKALSRSIQASIVRLAQKGRAAGIHVVLATQRPSVDVISGLIKTNFPTRIAFRVFSMTDSRTILDTPGAEKLIGKGDMLYYAGSECERAQCAYISNDEINAIARFIEDQQGWKKSYSNPHYLPEVNEEAEGAEGGGMIDMSSLDENFEEAARMVVQNQRGSTSDLQRRLGMGYARSGKVMDQLEAAGIVGPQEGSKPRKVLVATFSELDEILSHFLK